MPRKELGLVARDLGFYLTGRCDCTAADWTAENWLYPLDWGYQLDRPDQYFAPFDENGIPLREIPGAIPLTYLPSRIAAYGLANWNRAQRDTQARRRFLACANWFASQSECAFRHDFPLVAMPPGWLSCIAQGEGISVLVRAQRMTGAQHYADCANAAADWLDRGVADGGLLDLLPDGRPFLEEYPRSQYRHVLNGCLYALVGLSDLVRSGLSQTAEPEKLLNAVMDAVEIHIDRWDLSGWTTYDYQFETGQYTGQPANPNTLTYQTLHWILLDYLGRVHNRGTMVARAANWRDASASLLARVMALTNKVRFRLHHGYRH
ncbi:MAG: hypothetical protein IPH79_05920 [Sphingomonadales bacterium]|nr:hypothetical protein [Sphingomonadales bacterium]